MTASDSMTVKIFLPSELLFEEQIHKLTAEGQSGHFCLLPKHIDLVTSLIPGLLTCSKADGTELYFAVNEGILVKQEREVTISVLDAVQDTQLGRLHRLIEETYHSITEEDKLARSAVARLETNLVRRFIEFKSHG